MRKFATVGDVYATVPPTHHQHPSPPSSLTSSIVTKRTMHVTVYTELNCAIQVDTDKDITKKITTLRVLTLTAKPTVFVIFSHHAKKSCFAKFAVDDSADK